MKSTIESTRKKNSYLMNIMIEVENNSNLISNLSAIVADYLDFMLLLFTPVTLYQHK